MGTAVDERIPVLFLHTATAPPLGADTWIHVQILRALDRSRFRPVVACSKGPADDPTPTARAIAEVADVDVVGVDLGPELSTQGGTRAKVVALARTIPAVWHIARLVWIVRRRKIRIVHTSDRPRDAFTAVLLARLTRATSVVHVHVAYSPQWMGRMLRWSLGHADVLVGVSEYVSSTLVAGGHDATRVRTVRNSIDVAAWTPGAGRAEGRSRLGLDDGQPVVLCVCRLFAAKGVADLIRAVGAVRAEHPDVRLLVVGRDVTGGSYLAELHDLVATLDLGDAVDILGLRSDISELMAVADVYAMASFEEPFGLVFAEAMAMERPVVALANGGTVEVVDNGTTGLLSAPSDAAALTSNLARLLGDPALRREMGEAGRRRVAKEFDLPRMARDVERVYASIVSDPISKPARSLAGTEPG